MPPPLWRRTLWKSVSGGHTLIHWVCSSILQHKSVILFRNVTDVSHTHHILPDMTEFRDEAIAVWTMAPIEVQVTTFQSMWHSNPPTGKGDPHTPPYRTPPNEETPHRIHAQLGDLNDSELRQLIRDLL